jgi:uncharacterized membrane protein YhaH (DUF805 family)
MSNEQELNSPSINSPAFAEIKFFSPGARINRLRYWAHSMLMTIPFYLVLGIGVILAVQVSGLFWGLAAVAYVGMIVYGFILIIQRLHDLDKSGWLSLLVLVPFANLYIMVLLIFFKGTDGPNKYGVPPPPNKTWHWILGVGGPFLFALLGIAAAIVALPAYQDYALRVHEAQIQSQNYDAQHGVDNNVMEETPTDEVISDEESMDEEPVDDEAIDEAVDEAITDEQTEAPSADVIK